MQVTNSTASLLGNLLQAYKAKGTTTVQTATASSASDSSPVTDSATFSAESLRALEAHAALGMLTTDATQSGGTGTTGLAALLGNSSTGSTDPLAALFGNSTSAATGTTDLLSSFLGNATATTAAKATPAQLMEQVRLEMAQAQSSLFSDSSATDPTDPSAASDSISALLTSYSQTIAAQQDRVVQQALDRVAAAKQAAATTPGTTRSAGRA